MRGNIDGDPTNTVDLKDLSMLISYLIVDPVPFPCKLEADINGSGLVDLADLSILISYLTAGTPMPSCP